MRWIVPTTPKNARIFWLLVLLLVYWAIGFYPFHWKSPIDIVLNGALPIPNGEIDFHEPGIAELSRSGQRLKQIISAQSLKLKMIVKAKRTSQFGPARIFTISKNSKERNLTLAQEGPDLLIRLRRPGANVNGMPAYIIKDVFSSPKNRQIELDLNATEFMLHVDGQRRLYDTFTGNVFLGWSTDHLIALGNELTFDRPWLGSINRLEIYTASSLHGIERQRNAFTFPYIYVVHSNRLNINTTLSLFKDFFSDRNRLDRWVNLLGFIPLGMVLIWLFRPRIDIFRAALFCAGLSLSIETAQLFFESRHPSVNDFALNCAGGLIGAWVAYKFLDILKPA